MKSNWWQGSLFYLLILVTILAFAVSVMPFPKGPEEVSLYTFFDRAKAGSIDTIQQKGESLVGIKGDKEILKTSFVGSTKELMDALDAAGIKTNEGGNVRLDVKTGGLDWGSVLLTFLPLTIFSYYYFFINK